MDALHSGEPLGLICAGENVVTWDKTGQIYFRPVAQSGQAQGGVDNYDYAPCVCVTKCKRHAVLVSQAGGEWSRRIAHASKTASRW